MPRHCPFNKDEQKFILENLSTKSTKELSTFLKVDYETVRGFLFRRNLKAAKKYIKKTKVIQMVNRPPAIYSNINYANYDFK